jgi:hypothetical protein
VYDGHRSEAKLLSATTMPSAAEIISAAWQAYLTLRNLLNRIPNRVIDLDGLARSCGTVVEFPLRLCCAPGKAIRIQHQR